MGMCTWACARSQSCMSGCVVGAHAVTLISTHCHMLAHACVSVHAVCTRMRLYISVCLPVHVCIALVVGGLGGGGGLG